MALLSGLLLGGACVALLFLAGSEGKEGGAEGRGGKRASAEAGQPLESDRNRDGPAGIAGNPVPEGDSREAPPDLEALVGELRAARRDRDEASAGRTLGRIRDLLGSRDARNDGAFLARTWCACLREPLMSREGEDIRGLAGALGAVARGGFLRLLAEEYPGLGRAHRGDLARVRAYMMFDLVRRVGAAADLDAFAPLLSDQEESAQYLRHECIRTLGQMRARRFIPDLWAVFRSDPQSDIQEVAAEALARLGERDILTEVLDRLISEKDAKRKARLLDIIARYPDEQVAFGMIRDIVVVGRQFPGVVLMLVLPQIALEHREEPHGVLRMFKEASERDPVPVVRAHSLTALNKLAELAGDEEVRALGLGDWALGIARTRGDMENAEDQTEACNAAGVYMQCERDGLRVLATLRAMLESDERRCLSLLWGIPAILEREKDPGRRERLRGEAVAVIVGVVRNGKDPNARRAAIDVCGYLCVVEMVEELRKIAADRPEGDRLGEAANAAVERIAAVLTGK